MKSHQSLIALLLVALASCDTKTPVTIADPGPKPQSLPTVELKLNGTPFQVQVAEDDNTRETGLMYVHQMPADRGMIFVFPTEKPLAFWMKNTPIDLDIVFVDHTNKVVSVKTMHAYDTTTIPSEGPATYAIELNAGAATQARVTVGQVVDIPAGVVGKGR